MWSLSTDFRDSPQYENCLQSESGSGADTCRQTDGQTAEMTKLIGAFRECANETTKPDL